MILRINFYFKNIKFYPKKMSWNCYKNVQIIFKKEQSLFYSFKALIIISLSIIKYNNFLNKLRKLSILIHALMKKI